ncbi:MAG: V-type ATP synthase subunit A, partial [Planctomycetota bacterium]
TSRWAEALREVSSRLEEMPAEEGYPAYLSSRMARFYERAGVMRNRNGSVGSVSIIGAVSPPGGDFSEPVTQHTQRYTRCFWMLDRDLAYSRHFPAVSWQESYSEYVDDIEGWWTRRETEWPALRREAMNILQEHDELQEIVQLVGPDVLPDSQRLVLLSSEILREGFLQQDAFHEIDAYCAPEKQARLLKIILTFHRRAADIIESGAPVMRVRELNAVQQLKRARLSSRYEDAGALKDLMDQVNHQLDELEADYR